VHGTAADHVAARGLAGFVSEPSRTPTISLVLAANYRPPPNGRRNHPCPANADASSQRARRPSPEASGFCLLGGTNRASVSYTGDSRFPPLPLSPFASFPPCGCTSIAPAGFPDPLGLCFSRNSFDCNPLGSGIRISTTFANMH